MDDEEDWQTHGIEAFEAAYKRGIPCNDFYSAAECAEYLKRYCLSCGWHIQDHGEDLIEP